ncbi:MAG: hypothetical protein JXA30_00980, partial [Deltaproteobacteria bacterium]|nr:hypothetical protein [Deltaproteobacteria bacterium]
AVPDEPARGRKPVLRDELAAVVVKQQYPPERLRFLSQYYQRANLYGHVARLFRHHFLRSYERCSR